MDMDFGVPNLDLLTEFVGVLRPSIIRKQYSQQVSLNLLEHSVTSASGGGHVAGPDDLGGRHHGLGRVELVASLEVGVVRDGGCDALIPGMASNHRLVDQGVVALRQYPLLHFPLIVDSHLLVLGI